MGLLLRSLSWQSVKDNMWMLIGFMLLELVMIGTFFVDMGGLLYAGMLVVMIFFYVVSIDKRCTELTKLTGSDVPENISFGTMLLVIVYFLGYVFHNFKVSIFGYVPDTTFLWWGNLIVMISIWYVMATVYLNYTFSSAFKSLLIDIEMSTFNSSLDKLFEEAEDTDNYNDCEDCDDYTCPNNEHYQAYNAGYVKGGKDTAGELAKTVLDVTMSATQDYERGFEAGKVAGHDAGYKKGYDNCTAFYTVLVNSKVKKAVKKTTKKGKK